MNEIILVEGKIDFNVIEKKIFNNNSLVVSFDFDSHKTLNQNKIKHKLVEDYFSEEDKIEIDSFSLKLGTSWYKNEKISQYLEYDKINLGSLLELEMPSYFLKILKRVIGIKKIVEKEEPKKIISYSLKKYVNEFCKKKEITIKNYEKRKETGLFFDEISIPLSLGVTTKNIKISRKNYFRLKKIMEKISNSIWRTKLNKKLLLNNESILLIDFNTKLYEDLLKSFPVSNKNIIILNQRKPAIWNLETLQIIKNSN